MKREGILAEIIAGTGSIRIVEFGLDQIAETVPKIWEIADGKFESDAKSQPRARRGSRAGRRPPPAAVRAIGSIEEANIRMEVGGV